MARKKSRELTEAELRLMDVIWKRGPATVAEVAEALPEDLGLAYNTVLTTMRILEDKGYLRHTKAAEGRAFVYHAVVGQKEASRNAVKHLLSRFFSDSPEELVLNLLEDEQIGEAELRRIQQRIGGGIDDAGAAAGPARRSRMAGEKAQQAGAGDNAKARSQSHD